MYKKFVLVGLLLLFTLLLPSKTLAVDSAYITNSHLVFALTYRVHENPYNEYLEIGHYDFLPGGSLTAHYYLYNAGMDRLPTPSGKKNRYQLNYPSGQACNSDFALPTWEELTQKNGNWSFDPAGNKITISLDNIGVFNWTLQDEPTQYYALSGISSIPNYANHSIGFAYLTKSPVVTDQPLDRNSLYDTYSGVLYQNNGHATADWTYYPQGMSFAPYLAPYDSDILNYGYPCDGGMYCGYHYLLNNNPYSKNIYYQRNGHDFNRDLCMDYYGHSSILFGTLENGKIASSVTLEYSSPGDGYPIISVGSWYAPAAFLSPTPTPTPTPPPPPLQSASFTNNTITVTFNNPYATISDWIGFYNPPSLADSEWGKNWKWLNNSQTQSSAPITSGTVTFTPPASGTYDVRYFFTSANRKIDSKTVSVTLILTPTTSSCVIARPCLFYSTPCTESFPAQGYCPTPTPTPQTTVIPTVVSCTKKALGDANCDNQVDGMDYSIWLNTQCHPMGSQTCSDKRADYNKDGNIDDEDYQIWMTHRN